MNIFIREMKANRKSLIGWSIGVLFMVVGGMGKYVGSMASGQSMNDIIAKMPKALQEIIGVGPFDLSKASGYFGMLFLYLVVMATIHAAVLGASILSKEEQDKTAEFLFVKPVSRNRIITSKLFAAFVNILILNVITTLSSIAMVGHYSKGEAVTGGIIKLMVGMFILQSIFMLIGTAIASISKGSKTTSSTATGILLVTFILSKAIDLNDKLEPLKYITPFKYYEAQNLILRGFEPIYVILSSVIISVLFGATYAFYRKRDLNV